MSNLLAWCGLLRSDERGPNATGLAMFDHSSQLLLLGAIALPFALIAGLMIAQWRKPTSSR